MSVTTIVTMRVRAFAGVLWTHKCSIDDDGTVRVYDRVAGHYTRRHTLSAQDLGRIRAAARRAR